MRPYRHLHLLIPLALSLLLAACGGSTDATPRSATTSAPVATTLPTTAPIAATATAGRPTAGPTVPVASAAATTSATAPAIATSSPGATPGQAGVRIVDFAFEPRVLTVPSGTEVTWTNTGVQHTVYSPDKVFGSEILEKGQTYRFTFTKPGTYNYVCGLHPEMKATIVVT